ncbi:MAG: hypothetical protein LBV54_05910 [Puniceicoccales bacterium]|jgi:hypothetical protein|nr:hypothetical protein [Puniceicoccales bacterium]
MFKKSNSTAGRRPFTVRERAMAVALLWVVALLLALVLFKQYRTTLGELETVRETATVQAAVFKEKGDITERLNAHIHRFEYAQSLQGQTLQGLIDRLARESGLQPESVQPRNETKGEFQILSVRLILREVPMERLLVFDDRLHSQRIPLAVTSVKLDSGARDTLNVTYDIATYRLRDNTKSGR